MLKDEIEKKNLQKNPKQEEEEERRRRIN